MSGKEPGRAEVPGYIIADLKKRFQGFPVPGRPFDPSMASPELLRKYGLPPKPDPESQKLLRETWDTGFGAPITLQEFVFNQPLVEGTDYRPQSRYVDEMPFAETRFETSSNWSGAYITANQNRQFLQIWGVWTIPDALKLPPVPLRGPAEVPYVCSNWIGLDGQRLYFNSSLPQMGTVSSLQRNGTTGAQAWTQWWARGTPNSAPLPIGLTVAPSAKMLCVLTAWDPQTVIFVMVNLSTQVAMAVQGIAPTVTLPNGTTAQPNIAGATAEWIVVRPRVPGLTTDDNFPAYGKTEFGHCVAVEGDQVDIFSLFGGLPQQLQGARPIRMFQVLPDPARTVFISMPTKLNNTSVRVKYGGF